MKSFSKEISGYLSSLLGEKTQKELTKALAHGKTIVISGNHCTGKTTLMSVLKTLGYNVTESDRVYELKLTNPLESRVKNLDVVLVDKFNSIQISSPDGVPITIELEETTND